MNRQNIRILVVEDDDIFAKKLKNGLIKAGFFADKIAIKENGERALSYFEECSTEGVFFDLIIMDCKLPKEVLGLDIAKIMVKYYFPYFLFLTAHFEEGEFREKIIGWERYNGATVRYHSKRSYADILETLDEMFIHFSQNALSGHFSYKTRTNFGDIVSQVISHKEIIAITMEGNKMTLDTTRGNITPMGNNPLVQFLESQNGRTPCYPFLQISKNCAINLAALRHQFFGHSLSSKDKKQEISINGFPFAIGATFYPMVKKIYETYLS